MELALPYNLPASRSFKVLQAPSELFIQAMNRIAMSFLYQFFRRQGTHSRRKFETVTNASCTSKFIRQRFEGTMCHLFAISHSRKVASWQMGMLYAVC